MAKGKIKKGLFIAGVILLAAFVLIIGFISPIAKYLIEKYSPKYLGRQVKMSWIYLNPFTGYVHISHLRIYEYQSDTVFFKAEGVDAKYELLKTFSKTYEIGHLTITKPWGRIIQNRRQFNFGDIIEKFGSDSTAQTKPSKAVVHFNLLNVTIRDGEFHYIEETIPVNYFIKDFNIKSPGLRWNVDSIGGALSFRSGPSTGDVKANFSINIKDMGYRIAVVVNKFSLGIIEQYLHDLANYGSFSANLDANVKASGNFNDELAVMASGYVGVNDFHFGKSRNEDFASFDTLLLAIKEINPKYFKYIIDSVALRRPFFKYERYDHLDNLQTMFGEGGANYKAAKSDSTKFNLIIQIADYVNVLAKNFLQSYYKIDRIAIYNADIKFNDYAIREKFSVAAYPLNITANSIDRNHKRVALSVRSRVRPYGSIGLDLTIDPKDYNQFELSYYVQKISVASFNPYIITYTSFPVDRGMLEVNGKWDVKNGLIQSDNHVLVLDPRIDKRLRKKDTKWVPVPLIMALVRTPGSAIDFDVPIVGNLKDPKFKLWGAIGEVVKNIFVKPPSVPYLAQVKKADNQLEKLLVVKWPMRSAGLSPIQDRFLDKMADFLKENKEATINILPMDYTSKEKEYTLFFEAKKKYCTLTQRYTDHGRINKEDSVQIDKMSVKDSAFVGFLDHWVQDSLMFTIQEKCMAFVGEAVVQREYTRLQEERENKIIAYFKNKAVEDRVKIKPAISLIPYDGFSYFRIDYQGDLPKALITAYEDMNDWDSKNPRAKYENERRENGDGHPEIQEARSPRQFVQNK